MNGEYEYFDGCEEIEYLYGEIFKLTFYDGNIKLYSSEVKKTSENSFMDITHIVDEMLVVKIQGASCDYSNSYKNVYQLYKGIDRLSSECFSSVVLLDNGYIALQKYGIGYNVKPT